MKRIFALACLSLILSACGEDIDKTLGFRRDPIDEFTVVKKAPLTLPPNYELRPPVPGAEPTQRLSTREEARQSLISEQTEPQNDMPSGFSPAEEALLNKSGGFNAPSDIRLKIDDTSVVEESEPEGFLGHWSPFGAGEEDKDADGLLNPAEESQRLKKEDVPTPYPVKVDAPGSEDTQQQQGNTSQDGS